MTRVAFLFPGQGTLPHDIPSLMPESARLYDRAAREGLPIERWLREGDGAALLPTSVAQVAVFLDSLAKTEKLASIGIEPDIVAGHSLGEYAALVAAGALAADTALDLVLRRGRLMARTSGGMLAVLKLDASVVDSLCARAGGGVVVANLNAPGQTVVAGRLDDLDRFAMLAEQEGGRVVRLAVAGPFHSPLMSEAAAQLHPLLGAAPLIAPRIPIVSSVSGREEPDPTELRRLLQTQMTACVRWIDVTQTLLGVSVTEAIEVGPGEVLANLGRRMTDRIRFRTAKEVLDG